MNPSSYLGFDHFVTSLKPDTVGLGGSARRSPVTSLRVKLQFDALWDRPFDPPETDAFGETPIARREIEVLLVVTFVDVLGDRRRFPALYKIRCNYARSAKTHDFVISCRP